MTRGATKPSASARGTAALIVAGVVIFGVTRLLKVSGHPELADVHTLPGTGTTAPTAAAPAPAPPAATDLVIGTVTDGLTIGIANISDAAWSNCATRLNETFDHAPVNVGARGYVVLPLTEFSASDGTVFDPATHIAKTLGMTCDTPSGRLTTAVYVRQPHS
jgi:hypothetical protein